MVIAVIWLVSAMPALGGDSEMELETLLTPQNMEKLSKGEVVLVSQSYKDNKGKMRAKGAAIVVVNRPPEDVWQVLPDFTGYPEFMPRMISAKPYMNDGNAVGVEFQLKVVFRKITYSILHSIDREKGVLTLRLDHSRKNDIADTSGIWIVKSYGTGKTILSHSVILDSGLAVPTAIEDYLTKRDLPNVVVAVKKRVESDGTFKK